MEFYIVSFYKQWIYLFASVKNSLSKAFAYWPECKRKIIIFEYQLLALKIEFYKSFAGLTFVCFLKRFWRAFWQSTVKLLIFFLLEHYLPMFFKFNVQNTLYNNFQMKNFNLFLLTVSLLICSSYSFISFGVVGPFTASAFTCLQSSVPDSIPYVIIRAYQNSESPSGVDTNALQTITNSFTAGYAADIYVEICRGINATSQINLVNSGVITPMMTNPSVYTNYLVYIKVEPSVNSACSWEAYTQQDNCNYLMEAANAVSNLGFWTPVVFSTSNIWSKFFGSNCENMALSTGALLSYADYETTGQVTSRQTFDDFLPFGGWSVGNGNIYIKQVGGNVTVPLLCSSTPWHAFVDQYWY